MPPPGEAIFKFNLTLSALLNRTYWFGDPNVKTEFHSGFLNP